MYFLEKKIVSKDMFLSKLLSWEKDYINNIKRKYKDILFFYSGNIQNSYLKISFLLEDIKITSKGQEYIFDNIYMNYRVGRVSRAYLSCINGVHPHIDGSGICMGNSGTTILTMLNNNFDSGYLALCALLCNIGPRPYYPLNSFDSEKKLCINCLEYKTPGYNKGVSMCQDCINLNGLIHKKEKCIRCDKIKIASGGKILKKGWICNDH